MFSQLRVQELILIQIYPKGLCLFRRKSFMQRFRFVSIQIVHDQDYLFSILIVLCYIFYKIRPVWNFPVFSYFHHSLPNQWLTCHKNITCSLAFIFIINLFQSAKYCEELELSLLQSASVAIHPYKPQEKHNYRDGL